METPEALLENYFKFNTAFEVDKIIPLAADDVVVYYPSKTLHGKEEYRRHLERTFRFKGVFSHNKVEPLRIFIKDDRAMVRWRFTYKLKFWCRQQIIEGINEYTFVQKDDKKYYFKLISTEQLAKNRNPYERR